MVATIRTLIESIISPSMDFYYGRDDFNNLEDNAGFPAAFLAPLEYDIIPSKSGYKSKRYDIILMFVKKSQLDYDYYNPNDPASVSAHATIFSTTDGYIDTFLTLFEKAGLTVDFSIDASTIKVSHLVNVFDLNVSGSMLRLTVDTITSTLPC